MNLKTLILICIVLFFNSCASKSNLEIFKETGKKYNVDYNILWSIVN